MQPVRVGLVGTGYAARLRAQAVVADRRSQLVAIAGNRSRGIALAEELAAELATGAQSEQRISPEIYDDWRRLIGAGAIDLVVVATVNRDHGAIVRGALEAGVPVVVDYPLSLSVTEGQSLLALARKQELMLHVEHIERLGGLHQTLLRELPTIGVARSVRYATINPQHPAPEKWTYSRSAFGFPFIGALSRVQRLTHAFGPVASVTAQSQFWSGAAVLESQGTEDEAGEASYLAPGDRFTACLCEAHLEFVSGLIGSLVYGKGDCFWRAERSLAVTGTAGMLRFEGETGVRLGPKGEEPLVVGGRRGLFLRDTSYVLNHMIDGLPLYIEPEESLYALTVADAIARAAQSGDRVVI